MNTYISEVQFENYRSCRRTKVRLCHDLSALIGPNGSGKTNFLNGLLLLKQLDHSPRDPREEEFLQSSSKIQAVFVVDGKELPLKAVVKYTTNDRNADEVISSKQSWNFREFTGEDKPLVFPLAAISELSGLFSTFPSERSFRSLGIETVTRYLATRYGVTYGSKAAITPRQLSSIGKVLLQVREFLKGVKYYSASQFTDPSACPTSLEFEDEKTLRRVPSRMRGEHVQFMYDLYSAYKNPRSRFQEFVSVVGREGVGLIDTIEYSEVPEPANLYKVAIGGRVVTRAVNRLLVIPNVLVGQARLSPNQLSEGTFKTLAIVFYLITDTSRLLILEEPEVCIHHGLLSTILELIKTFAAEKQIIISTHSDFVLDSLSPESVFLVRNDPARGTTVKHVPTALSKRDYKALKQYLGESGNLGEYWRHGDLEK